MSPTVSIITPTTLSRQKMLDWQIREHIVTRVLGEETFEALIREWIVIGDVDGNRDYFLGRLKVILSDATIGEKRQIGLEAATGDIIVQIDDDDWQHPFRIEKQVGALAAGADVVGTSRFYVAREPDHLVQPSRTWEGTATMPAGSLAYWRKKGLEIGWEPGLSAERGFLDRARKQKLRVVDMQDPSLYVLFRHGSNSSPSDWCVPDFDRAVSPRVLDGFLGPSWGRFSK